MTNESITELLPDALRKDLGKCKAPCVEAVDHPRKFLASTRYDPATETVCRAPHLDRRHKPTRRKTRRTENHAAQDELEEISHIEISTPKKKCSSSSSTWINESSTTLNLYSTSKNINAPCTVLHRLHSVATCNTKSRVALELIIQQVTFYVVHQETRSNKCNSALHASLANKDE